MIIWIHNIVRAHWDEDDDNKMWQIMSWIKIKDVSALPKGIILKFLDEFEKKYPELDKLESKIIS